MKGTSGFEAKKATNYELEAHSHGGVEEEDEDGEKMGESGQKFQGQMGKLCWLSCLVKLAYLLSFVD